MTKKNASIAATQIKGSEIVVEKGKEQKQFDQRKYLGIAAEVAQDTVYMSNTRWDNAEKHFPVDPLLRTTDKYFPYAAGGALYIDQPSTAGEVRECKRKAEAMRKEGLRYCYVPPFLDVTDGEYEDALQATLDQLDAGTVSHDSPPQLAFPKKPAIPKKKSPKASARGVA
jgi:hypothetical protein